MQNADIGQIPVFFIIVQAIAHHESIRNMEAGILHFQRNFSTGGLIQQRNVLSDEVLEWEVSGEHIEAVQMLPGYTHNIINLSETEDLVTVMWCNECFDPSRPDTFFEPVVK